MNEAINERNYAEFEDVNKWPTYFTQRKYWILMQLWPLKPGKMSKQIVCIPAIVIFERKPASACWFSYWFCGVSKYITINTHNNFLVFTESTFLEFQWMKIWQNSNHAIWRDFLFGRDLTLQTWLELWQTATVACLFLTGGTENY